MLRYICLVPGTESSERKQLIDLFRQRIALLPQGWRVVCTEKILLAVFTGSGSADRELDIGHQGKILGTVFRSVSDRAVPVLHLTSEEVRAAEDSGGRSLVTSFWGSYVAFVSGTNGTTYVLRGPMSRLASYWTRYRNSFLFFSHMEDCYSLKLRSFQVNWDAIRAQTIGGDFLTNETALNEVFNLEVGQCATVSNGTLSCTDYWNPTRIAAEHAAAPMKFEEAAEALRDTVVNCVRSIASSHRRLILLLSGGFDSSALLGCLATAPSAPAITAINYFSSGPGDELRYAREMARFTNTKLIEVQRPACVDLQQFLKCNRSVRPVLHFSAIVSDKLNTEFAREHEATAVFTGDLGDSVFGRSVQQEAIKDYVNRHGYAPGLLKVALDCAQRTRTSVFSVLRSGLAGTPIWQRDNYWSVYQFANAYVKNRLTSEDTISWYERELQRFIHPWFRDHTDLPPAIFPLLLGIVICMSANFDSPFAPYDLDLLTVPLASQPIVELVLRIPSYHHLRFGYDRALARYAFADYLCPAVLNRGTGKGTPEPWIREVVAYNRDFLTETLADGVLVSQGILDGSKIRELLSSQVTKRAAAEYDLFDQLYIEAWVRQWNGARINMAA